MYRRYQPRDEPVKKGLNTWRCSAITNRGTRCKLKITIAQRYYQEGSLDGMLKPNYCIGYCHMHSELGWYADADTAKTYVKSHAPMYQAVKDYESTVNTISSQEWKKNKNAYKNDEWVDEDKED